MRIENFTGIASANNSGIMDLISRLNAGDVIRAKVLETAPDGVVLKFSDGTVAKAKTLESPDVKAGQIITLTVVTRTEGTLLLETVKDPSRTTDINPALLKDMLESVSIKPDAANLELAAEFVKSGVEITADRMERALSHMRAHSGLNAGKAVFLTLNDIPTSRVDPGTLAGLLDGDIKIGIQLKNLILLLKNHENIYNSLGAKTCTASVGAAGELHDPAAATGRQIVDAEDIFERTVPGLPGSVNESESDKDVFLHDGKVNFPGNLSNANMQDKQANTGNCLGSIDANAKSALLRIIEEGLPIKELFIKTESGNLASKLNAGSVMKAVEERLEELKAAIRLREYQPANESKSFSTAVTLLDETTKILNLLNSKNVYYFQVPVNLAGYCTTAELYVMKRQKSKKGIDPKNAVMFISLDTQNMGRIETVVDLKGRSVSINLRTEKQQINEYIKENIKFLYSGLLECGYKLANIRYAIINAPTSLLEQEKILKKMVNERYGKVDCRV